MIRPLLASAILACAAAAQTPELTVISETGPRDLRVNITIIGDGYRAAEKASFLEHCRTFADAIVGDLPFVGYGKYFNIYAIFAASEESGADIPSQGVSRDTYFNAHYDANLDRLLLIDYAKGNQVINEAVPETDIRFAIVNSAQYGGSGGGIAVANYLSPEIVAHEVQHSFAKLGDEYDYPGIAPWEAPNTTQETDRASIRWTHWIAAATPVPTPETPTYSQAIGLFEGAAYNATGWYRPKQNCRMRANGIPFCAVCNEAILVTMYGVVSPIDSVFPTGENVTVAAGKPAGLRIVPKRPAVPLRIEWFVDGALQPGANGEIFNGPLTAGRHVVKARVSDPTAFVRQDPEGRLRDSVSWEVTVTPSSSAGMPGGEGLGLVGLDASGVRFHLPAAGNYRLRIMDLSGKTLFRRNAVGVAGWNMAAWPAPERGLFIMELRAGPGSLRALAFIR